MGGIYWNRWIQVSPPHLNMGSPTALPQPVGFFLPYLPANAVSDSPVTRQMRQSGRMSAPIAL
jgi:hypothetical protein